MSDYHKSCTNWKYIKVLGSGAFAKVSLWINVDTKHSVAIKRCSVDLDKLASDEKDKLEKRWKQESEWVSKIDTPHIVRACPDDCRELAAEQNRMSQLHVIIMEYCDGGNLRSKLFEIENVNGFKEHNVREILNALGNAISHLHNRYNITHRDIKPDNIVIKSGLDGKPIYKLTDMGYARIIDRNTIQGSMVGSKNYFAPEIVELAEYKNSVDYWSMGILAFEIICGVYPFLQDSLICEVLKCINEKPPGCIAITKTNAEKLCHHMQLFPENRLTNTFRKYIEPWLQLALEKNGRKRGYETPDEIQEPQLKFYTKLFEAINAKIFTVFWLNRCKSFSYCVNESMPMETLLSDMEFDTNVRRTHLYFVLPAGHTLDYLPEDVKPIQLYQEQFAIEDRTMLYLVDFETDSLCKPDNPFISESIQLVFNVKEKLQPRILKKCLLNVLFVHHNELRRMTEFVNGVHEYAMNLECEIMRQEQCVKGFQEKIMHYNGQATQYETMVAMGKQLLREKQKHNGESTETECEIVADLKNLFAEYQGIIASFNMILNNIREFMKKSPLPKYLERVTLHVKQFEDIFEEIRSNSPSISTSVVDLRNFISSLLKERDNFFESSRKWLQKSTSLTENYMEFRNIMNIFCKNQLSWQDSQMRMAQKTKEHMEKFADTFILQGLGNVIERMDTLHMDNDQNETSFPSNTDESVLLAQTANIINDSQNLSQALKYLWDI